MTQQHDPTYTTTVWLVFSLPARSYGDLCVRLTKKRPACGPAEIPYELKLNVKRSVFQRPALSGQIDIEGVPVRQQDLLRIGPEITELVKEKLGVTLQILPPENED